MACQNLGLPNLGGLSNLGRRDRTEMHVAGGDRQNRTLIVADHETAVLVNGLERAAHHITVNSDSNLPAKPCRARQPAPPDGGQPAPIVLTAWNHQLQLQTFDHDTVQRFIRSYKNKRGIAPEFGGTCAGVTTTVPVT